ncbi:MAG: YqiA/YcfP family alpha/beta fold hydrolase [Burkholderiales bacterium]
MLIYLHGFNSSPASHKANLLRDYMTARGEADQFICTTLPHWPKEAIAQVEKLIAQHLDQNITLIGSSLGGFYAIYLAEKYNLKAVLVNPAVKPFASLESYLGPQKNIYTHEKYTFTREHIRQMRDLDIRTITHPERYLLLTQTGDEVLDYREAVKKMAGAQQIIIEGGDHGFQNFSSYLDTILSFSLSK